MNAQELRGKTKTQLQQILLDLLREQFNLRMQRGSNQLARPARMKAVRRDVARVKTVMHESAMSNAP